MVFCHLLLFQLLPVVLSFIVVAVAIPATAVSLSFVVAALLLLLLLLLLLFLVRLGSCSRSFIQLVSHPPHYGRYHRHGITLRLSACRAVSVFTRSLWLFLGHSVYPLRNFSRGVACNGTP